VTFVGLIALGLLVLPGSAAAGQRGVCTSADVAETFLLPDGTMHEAGRITLCTEREYSPVRWLHAAYVDRMPVAMLISRSGSSEGRGTDLRPFFVFDRDAQGLLHLAGYAVPTGRGALTTYRMDPARVRSSRHMAKREGPAGITAGPSTVVLAASVR
jgi:hypothetical protein